MIKIVTSGGEGHGPNYKEFVISGTADVANLPTGNSPAPDTTDAGSMAFTQDMQHTYLLGTDNVWREV